MDFVKSNKAKHLNITVKPLRNVKVSVPLKISYSVAEKIVRQKAEWIIKHQKKMKKFEDVWTIFDNKTTFKTRHHSLELIPVDAETYRSILTNDKIKISYPKSVDVKNTNVQKLIRTGIERAYRKEAKEYLPERVRQLAEMHGFKYNKVFLKNVKSRWGSCSKKLNINLSIHLMRLPDELLDYIIIHELAHTVEHNHSKRYWAILDKIYGNSKSVDKKLRNYKIEIY